MIRFDRVVLLTFSLAILAPSCAHRPPARESEETPVYLYEVEFYFNGQLLEAQRPAHCFSEIICPKRSRDDQSPVEPRPMLNVSPMSQGRNAVSFTPEPSRNGGGGTLVVRIRLSNLESTLQKYVDKMSAARVGWASVEQMKKEPTGFFGWLPDFPVPCTVLVAPGGSPEFLPVGDYFFRKRQFRDEHFNDKDFSLDQRNEEVREYYRAPPPEGIDVKGLELNRWVEFRYEFDDGEKPRRIVVLSTDLDLVVDGF